MASKRQKSIKNFFRKASEEVALTTPESVLDSSTSPEASPQKATAVEDEPAAAPSPVVAMNVLDLGLYLGGERQVDDDLRKQLAWKPWTPDEKFDFPAQIIGGAKKRTFQLNWLKRYPWLAYSAAAGGALCRPCVLFATSKDGSGKGGHAALGQLVTQPFSRWKNALEEFNKHSVRDYHRHAVQACDDFLSVKTGAAPDVLQRLKKMSDEETRRAHHVLGAIIDTVVFCGRQEIALRGTDESGRIQMETPPVNDGNFRALIRFRMQAGDTILAEHMTKAPMVALYISPKIQNEIIDMVGNEISRQVVDRINSSRFFSVLADETTDIKRVSQLSLCTRSVDLKKMVVVEDFLGFFPVTDATGAGLAGTIESECTRKGLHFANCRGQGYDGAGAMKGKFKGVQAILKAKYPMAKYTHCSNHCLNLNLNDAATVVEMKQAFGVMKETCNFFKRSSPRSGALRKCFQDSPNITVCELVSVCEHRWVERHRAVIIFVEAVVLVVETLESLEGNDDDPGAEEQEKTPSSLHRAICNFRFLVTIVIVEKCMAVTYSLSKYLQSPQVDLFSAMERVQNTLDVFNSMRVNQEAYDALYKKAVNLAAQLGVEPAKPRTVGSQRYRSNQPADSVEDFYRNSVYYTYLDYLIMSLNERFMEHRREIEGLACIIPMECIKRSFVDLKPALHFYEKDLPTVNEMILQSEWEIWQQKWTSVTENERPTHAITALKECNNDLFPNMFTLLHLLATLPVTTATPERSFSLLKRLKSWLRNAMAEDRLVGLALMSVYRNLPIDKKKLIVAFFNAKARRL